MASKPKQLSLLNLLGIANIAIAAVAEYQSASADTTDRAAKISAAVDAVVRIVAPSAKKNNPKAAAMIDQLVEDIEALLDDIAALRTPAV